MEVQNDTDEDTLTHAHRNAATLPRRPSNSRRQEVDVMPDISAEVPDIEETLSGNNSNIKCKTMLFSTLC